MTIPCMVSAVRCLSISSSPRALPPPRRLAAAISSSSPRSLRVAVIGAGASGLVAARELRREGHGVAVYERGAGVGGTWIYTDETESDPLGLDPTRGIVHSSLYESLRTNLPRECMGFLDYPFVARGIGGGDPRRFPGHWEVLRYLEGFAREFKVMDLVRLRTEVLRVEMAGDGEGTKWRVKSRRGGDKIKEEAEEEEEVYDAVVVCNGHYTEPRLADFPGIGAWPGKQIHSHNYRVPEPFHDQVVVIIGSSSSAADISRDIAGLAKEVHVACRSGSTEGTPKRLPGYNNTWLHSMIEKAHENGVVTFEDGSSLRADVIMHCTGYKFHFPFLETDGIVTVDDDRVGPLYKHVFPPLLAPFLSFVGLQLKAIPFPVVELQSKWMAAVLSGRVALPTLKEMMDDVEAFYAKMEIAGLPKRYTHNMAQYQFEYCDWLANECGCPGIEEWRKLMFMSCIKNKKERPESFRDEWDDDHLVEQALRDFEKFLH